jgi:uncharacterized iron-regulated membrane protein
VTQRRWYAAHRWLGIVVGLQLVAWSAGGVIFSTHAIDWVRSERGKRAASPNQIPLERVRVSPADAVRSAGIAPVHVELRTLLERPVYEVKGISDSALVDAESGVVVSPLTEAAAVAIARTDREGSPAVIAVQKIERDSPIEYRGQPLPAWCISFGDAETTHVYVDARTGVIRARRNSAWRRYDFFWMLHTMDYRGRDDFNHPLLVAFAATGLVAVLSGWALWVVRFIRRLRGAKITR